MTSEQLKKAIANEEERLAGYKEKRTELDDKIRKSEAKIRELKMMANSKTFDALAGLVEQKGLSVEDLITALKGGDLLGLQEQMEAVQRKAEVESGEMDAFVAADSSDADL